MDDLYYSISEAIFNKFPGYSRGVVLAFDVMNQDPSPPDLIKMIRETENSVRENIQKEKLIEHPLIASWRNAYRSFGSKPAKYRSSIEAMVRRVLNGNELPSINRLVDIGNVLSLKYLAPTGGHAIDHVRQDIALRMATGEEEFTAFGSQKTESPIPGEVIFAEGNRVLTRRWTWRQANHTLTLPETKAIEFNVDGLPPVSEPEVEKICEEVIEMVKRFCGGRMRFEILNGYNAKMKITE